jgi:hypothetical protein
LLGMLLFIRYGVAKLGSGMSMMRLNRPMSAFGP